MIDLAVRNKLASYPASAVPITVKRKRKSGRQKNSLLALEHQPPERLSASPSASDSLSNESDSTSYDSDDDDVAARQTQPISSAQPISSTQPTSSRQQTSTQSVCSTCGTQMKKKLHAYCPNCSKQKNEAKRLKKN